jgi:UDP-N-acetylmuramate dehydrogenase
MNTLYTHLKQFGHVKPNALVAKLTTFKIGGLVQFLIEVPEADKLVELLKFLTGEGIPYFILGGGSNMVWQDELFEGVVIKVESRKSKVESDRVTVDAGMPLASVVTTFMQHSLSGMEWAAGVPGTVGGAVRGNAGAMDSDTARSIEKVLVFRDGEVVELKPEECSYGYRESIFKHNQDIILQAMYKTTPGDKKEILKQIQENIKGRNGKYPAKPSAGSFFKNVDFKNWKGDLSKLPEHFAKTQKVPAGWINEQNGLKGFQIGGAMISKEHGNFLINFTGEATQADVIALKEEAQKRAMENFGVELEPEVVIVEL